MKKLFAFATDTVDAGQLSSADHVRFPRVDYIELRHLNANLWGVQISVAGERSLTPLRRPFGE